MRDRYTSGPTEPCAVALGRSVTHPPSATAHGSVGPSREYSMKSLIKAIRRRTRRPNRRSQRGTALIIAIMIMALLAGFVAASLSRVTNEALMMGNDQANTEAYFVAQAALEHTTREFSDVFDVRIRPTPTDKARIIADIVPGYDTNFTITPEL